MTAPGVTPSTAPAHRARPGHEYDVRRFLALLDHQRGYVETFAGAPNPDRPENIDKLPGTQRFTFIAPDADHTASNVLRRLDDYHRPDVYLSVLSYRTRDRDAAQAQPGRVVFVDDYQPGAGRLIPNFGLETSPGNFQGFYVVERALTRDEYTDLARRAAAALSGDPSGVDLTQVCRVPGSYNTKGGRRWRVRLVEWRRSPYTIAELRAAWPAVAPPTPRTPAARQSPGPEWQNLPDGAALLRSRRWQTLIDKRPQLTALIRRRERVTIEAPGRWTADDSDSAQVAVFVCNVTSAYDPPPADEIRAVALALKPTLRPNQPRDRYQADIDRLLVRYPFKTTPTPTRYIPGQPAARLDPPQAPLDPPTLPQRRPRGRPAGRRANQREKLRRALRRIPPDDWGRIVYDSEDLAKRLKVGARSLRNYLRDLEAAGELRRGQIGGNGRPFVVLCGVENKSARPPKSPPKSAPVVGEIRVEAEEATQGAQMPQTGCNEPQCNGSTHPPHSAPLSDAGAAAPVVGLEPAPLAPAARAALGDAPRGAAGGVCTTPPPERAPDTSPQDLRALVREALDRAGLDVETGELRCLSLRRVQAYIAVRAPEGVCWPAEDVERLYREERARRSTPWPALRAAARAMADVPLLKAVAARARTLARHIGKPREGYHRVRWQIVEEERRRRGLSLAERPSPTDNMRMAAAIVVGVSIPAVEPAPAAPAVAPPPPTPALRDGAALCLMLGTDPEYTRWAQARMAELRAALGASAA